MGQGLLPSCSQRLRSPQKGAYTTPAPLPRSTAPEPHASSCGTTCPALGLTHLIAPAAWPWAARPR